MRGAGDGEGTVNSELSGASADRPDRWDRGDRLREDDPGPDVTPVPASADYRAPGITRQEAYAAVGQADQTPNAFLRERAGSRDEHGKGPDAQESTERGAERSGADQSGADREQDGQLPDSAAGVRPGDGQAGDGQPGNELRGPGAGEGIRPDPSRLVPGEIRGPGADGAEGAGGIDGADRGDGWPSGRAADVADSRDVTGRGDQDGGWDGRRSRPDADGVRDWEDAGRQSADQAGERERAPGPDRERTQSQSQEQARETVPEARTDHQRMAEGTEGEQRMQAVIAGLRAENAGLKAENAEIRQQLGETNAKLDEQGSKLDAILAALGPGAADTAKSPRETGEPEDRDTADADQQDRRPSPDHPQDEDRDRPQLPDRPDKPNPTKPDQRNDALATGADEASDDIDPTENADIEGHASARPDREGHMAPAKAGRHVFTAENIGAVGAGVALAQSVGETFAHMPPEVGVGASALGFIGASMATSLASLAKNAYKKWKG
ncbi:MAG: hypothetical protein J2P25_15115 [Nocardiopsaceae bacterium]|nr:hypothetical protein [Nocardiopsaceae bacterium]